MKPRSAVWMILTLALMSGLVSTAQAVPLTWDANGTTAGVTDGAGAWLGANLWTNLTDGGNTMWISGSDAIFGNGGNGGAVTLASPTTANSLTFNAFSGTYTLGTTGQNITLTNGITMNASAGAVTLSSPITLGADQTWANNASGGLLVSSTVDNGGFLLTVDGSSPVTMKAGIISGSGGLTKNGPGFYEIGGQYFVAAHTYAGTTTINGGTMRYEGNLPSGNLTLNGGVLDAYWATSMTRSLGTGTNQVQIPGGVSGFGCGSIANVTIANSAAFEVVWGTANEAGNALSTGYFNPSTLVLNAASSAGTMTFANKLDLNGTTRTVQVNNGIGVISGVIRSSTGTAGFNKTGPSTLSLSAANTFTGPVTINGGILSINSIANGGANSALGASGSGASSLLLGNGGILLYTGGAVSSDRSFTINGAAAGHTATLDASGTGALNLTSTATPAYGTVDQTRTLILTGTQTGNNTLAATLADNGTGALSVTKTGAGTWVLTGNSTYTGATTLSAGLLSIGATNNLGSSSANLIFNGGGLRITGTTLTSFSGLGRTIVFNPGVTVTLDIADAANTFTVDQPIPDNVNFVMSGAGRVVFSTNNTYTGQTTISGGVLRYDDGPTIPTTPLLNNGALVINRTDTLTQGTTFHSIMGGTGSLTNIGAGTLVLNNINTYTGTTKANAGTIQLNHARALQNSAIDTTGGGSITLGTVTTPTFGGLSGGTGDLGNGGVLATGYSGVTALTLNPQTGITFTYGGVIGNGASGMTLTKTGAGTQILQGANTYTGATTLKEGTLTLSGSGSILTSPVALSGGGLTLANAVAEAGSGRVADATGITANGGTITYNNTTQGNTYAETIGSVALTRGQLNVVEAVNLTSGSQTLTLAGLTQSGTAAVTFSAAGTAPNTTRNIIVVTGASASLVVPWATVGTTAALQTDYAAYNGSAQVVPAAIAATTEGSWTGGATADYTSTSTANTLLGDRTMNSWRYNAAAGALTLGTYNFDANGILNGGSGPLTISAAGGAVRQQGTSATNLYITTGNNAITISAPINDNTGALTLVKNGSGGTLTLSGSNGYTGGTVLNAGSLTTTADANLGIGGGITVNGVVTWNGGDIYNHARSLAVNEGAVLYLSNGSGVTGVLSGNGTLTMNSADGFKFTNANNTFSGAINASTANSLTYGLEFASIGDDVGAGLISLDNGSFRWVKASGGTTTLANRQFALSGTTGGATFSALGTTSDENLIINKNLLVTGVGNKTLRLAGTNTGNNRFAGNITDGPGSVISLTKEEAGTWSLSGTNTHTGPTTVSVGTLVVNNPVAIQNSTMTYTAGTLNFGTPTHATFGGLSGGQPLALTNSAGSAVALTVGGNGSSTTYSGVISGSGSLAKTGSGSLTLSATNTYSGATTVSAGTLNLTGSLTGGSAISIGGSAILNQGAAGVISGAASLTHNSSGTSILAGTNTYTGATTISNGTLKLTGGGALASTNITIWPSGILDVTNKTSHAMTSASTYTFAITNSSVGRINAGTLDITAARVALSGVFTNGGTYIIATYTSLVGTAFAWTNGNYNIDYNFNEWKQIAIIQPSPSAPHVINAGANNQTASACTLQGVVTNGTFANAWICWGTNDAGAFTTGNWQNVVPFGSMMQGVPFSTVASPLNTNMTYWYRCYASNTYGTAWSDPPTSFSAAPASGGSGGSGGTPVDSWTPSNLTSVALWLDAADTNTLLLSGSSVTNWLDKSGNSQHLSQGTGSFQPTNGTHQIGGLNALRFDKDFLRKDSFVFTGTTAQILCVQSFGSTSDSSGRIVSMWGGTAADWNSLGSFTYTRTTTTTGAEVYRNSAGRSSSTGGYDAPFIGGGLWDSSNMFGNVNGTLTAGVASSGSFTGTRLTIGANESGTTLLVGTIGEVIILTDVSVATRQKLEGYLAWKWGLQANLPSNHPFKLGPPSARGGVVTYTDSSGLNPTNTPYAGGYVVHTFYGGSDTFSNATATSADVLVVGGGGGGGSRHGGGGGAGGLIYTNGYPVFAGSNYTVTVGFGGAGNTSGSAVAAGWPGTNSVFGNGVGALIAYGGGFGGATAGGPGGSGGGGGYDGGAGGASTNGQGWRGGTGIGSYAGRGGGGAGGQGVDGGGVNGSNGGPGTNLAISGTATWYAGGGGGGSQSGVKGTGGSGIGGDGGQFGSIVGGTGAVNTGSGGGGGGGALAGSAGGNGGTGIVIVRYLYGSAMRIQNLAPAAITNTAAVLNASLSYATTNYDVYVHWGIIDGTTNAGVWTGSALAGSFTNVASTHISYTNTSLSLGTTYYYTFRAMNASTNIWATPSWQFTTSGFRVSGSVFRFR